MTKKTIELAFKGQLLTLNVKSTKIVCPTCKGTGSHVNPSIDGNGLTFEDFQDDPDFEESYFNGDYDVTCRDCNGNNVIDEINFEEMEKKYPRLMREYYAQMQEQRNWDMDAQWERNHC